MCRVDGRLSHLAGREPLSERVWLFNFSVASTWVLTRVT